MALTHPYTAKIVAQTFIQHLFKLHGRPSTIISDKDPVFTSSFWKELFCMQATQLNYSTAYHLKLMGRLKLLTNALNST